MALLIIGLILFVLLVVVHELGHFIAARRGGVEVEEFGVGFPPKIYGRKFKKHATEYTINLLPLGGFVRLKGEHDADTEKGSFGAASLSRKTKILLAGVGMNLLTAFVLLMIIAWAGMPRLPLPNGAEQFTVSSDSRVVNSKLYVTYVEPGSPAEQQGALGERDSLISATTLVCQSEKDCQSVSEPIILNTQQQLINFTESNASKLIRLEIKDESENRQRTVDINLRSTEEVEASRQTDEPKGYLGVGTYEYQVARSTWSAPIVAAGLTVQFTKLTLQGLGSALWNLVAGNANKASENVSGPIGIFFILKDGSSLGYNYILLIVALLSLTLAIMNVLPIPALDGGRLAVMLGFRAFKKPLTPRLEEKIHATGFMALIGLIILISIVDVKRFF